jgi:threonine dehydrogenase-like Zn-dependent dehydrogenase
MPKQLIALAPKKASITSYEDREIKPNEVKVKVENASPKHGSELACFRGESPHTADYFDEEWNMFLPRNPIDVSTDGGFGKWNLGNQWVGVIMEKGPEVTEYAVGDRVCCYGGIRETHIVIKF